MHPSVPRRVALSRGPREYHVNQTFSICRPSRYGEREFENSGRLRSERNQTRLSRSATRRRISSNERIYCPKVGPPRAVPGTSPFIWAASWMAGARSRLMGRVTPSSRFGATRQQRLWSRRQGCLTRHFLQMLGQLTQPHPALFIIGMAVVRGLDLAWQVAQDGLADLIEAPE